MIRFFLCVWLCVFALSVEAVERSAVAESPELVSPLMNGQFVPDVVVKTELGQNIRLQTIVESKPTVILFYRGGWCPYCNRQMAGLIEVEQRILDLGYQIVAISPDPPERLAKQSMDDKFDVLRLSDANLHAIRQFGLAYFVPQATAEKYVDKLGAKLTTLDGTERVVLPIPAAFVVDTTGLIKFQYANPNYQVRVEPQLLYYAAKIAR